MVERDNTALREASPYSGVLMREQFLFYETSAKNGIINTKAAARALSAP